MHRVIRYAIFFVVLHTTATCQTKDEFPLNENYFLKHFGQAQGLPDQGMLKIAKDRHGFLWLGGWHGLCMYDGQKFTTFSRAEGLPHTIVTDIKIDAAGLIYVATFSGISRYTGAYPMAFKNYPIPAALSISSIGTIYPIDSSHIYFADEHNRALYFIHGDSIDAVKGFDGIAMDMQQDKGGTLFLMITEYLLYAVRGSAVTNVAHEPFYEEPVGTQKLNHQLEKDSLGNVFYNGKTLWLLQNSKKMLEPYTIAKKQVAHYNYTARPPMPSIFYAIKDTGLAPLFRLPDLVTINSGFVKTASDIFWFAIDGAGLNCYYRKLYKPLPSSQLLAYYITDAWGRRVVRNDSFLYKNPVIRHFYTTLTDPLRNIYLARDGTVWFCSSATGVYYLKKGSNTIQHYKHALHEDVFLNGIEDNKGTVWLESFNGIVSYKDGQFRNWGVKEGIKELAFYTSANDKKGIHYTAGTSNIYAWYNDTPRIITDQLKLQPGYYRLAADNGLDVWTCTNSNLVIKISSDGKGNFFPQDSLALAINGRKVIPNTIAFDRYNNLWAAGYGFLLIYRRQPDGKYIDGDKLVISSDQHLDEFTAKRAALRRSEDGNTIFLNDVSFDVDAVMQNFNSPPPVVSLRQVRLFQQQQNWAALGQQTDNYGIPVKPVLNSTQNDLSFYFTGIAETEQDGVVYQYKLEGYDKDWEQLTTATKADYTNLPEGKYTFFVRAANISGRWSESVGFAFTILPPWYRTWWATLLWILLAAGILSYFFLLRLKGVKRREALKRTVVEQQLKALRAQINPHFLQNSFVFLSQSLAEKPLHETQSVMSQLSVYLRHVLDLSDQSVIKLEEEIEFANEYLEVNKLLFKDAFTYNIAIADDVDTFGITVPSMLLQPILENAIKHGVRHTALTATIITVNVYCDGDFACCAVSNTIAAKQQSPIYKDYKPKGLQITEQRLRLLYKGSKMQPFIKISSHTDKYEVIILIPLN